MLIIIKNIILWNINYIYENDNYYFYEVILDIYIYPREPLVVSSELENILNEALGNSYGTPITRGELSKIKVLDLKGIDSSNINPVIFQYMPNLVELNLSSCNINEDFLSYLSTLTKLESLDLSNNNLILDLNKLPKTLIDSLHCLDISFEKSEVKPCENAYTSLDRDILINRITDIYPLSYFINLQVLKLKGQGIYDISSLSTLTNLVYLDISDQEINRGSILPSEELCSSSCDFSLETVFLKDINGELPTILCISDRGYCYSLENGVCYPTGQYCDSCDSCDFIQDCKCNLIIWENIYSNTDVYFTFKDELIDENKIFIFSGVINLNLNIE